MFGHVGTASSSRGELFLFWSLYPNSPVLIALMAGEAADTAEEYDEKTLVDRCMSILRVIFGAVPHVSCTTCFRIVKEFPAAVCSLFQPTGHVVTRWATDPWSLGTYSYVGVDATGKPFC